MPWFRHASLALLLLRAAALAQPMQHQGMAGPVLTAEPLQIEAVVAEIRGNNPQLRAARSRVEAARERLPQAKAWDDPRVGVDLERTNRRLLSYNDAEWSVSQTLPVTGKIARRKQVASAEITVAEAAVRQIELELEARARASYFKLANAEAQLGVNLRTQALLRQLIEVTRAKYESGRQRQSDVLMAETEFARLQEARVDQLRDYSEAQTALNTLMNRAPQTLLGHAALPEFSPTTVSLESLQARAAMHRPQLAAADSRIAVAQARVALAERERFPEPELRVEARQFNGTALYNMREYDTGVFIALPWVNGGKYRAAIREAKRTAEAEQHERRGLESETAGMVRDAWQRLQTFQHHVELFRDRLLPLARQTIDATRSSYEADRATLPEVLTAERTAQDVESMYYHHLAEYFAARAELVPLVGVFDLPASP
jgi:outer membrane protein TolC